MDVLKYVILCPKLEKYLLFVNTSSVLFVQRSQVRETAHCFEVLNSGTLNMHQNFDDLWNFQGSEKKSNY